MKNNAISVFALVLAFGFAVPATAVEGLKSVQPLSASLENDLAINEVFAGSGETLEVQRAGVQSRNRYRYDDDDSYDESHEESWPRYQSQNHRQSKKRKRKAVRQGTSRPSTQSPASTQVVRGEFQYVVCTRQTELLVRDGSLSDVLFAAERFAPVKVFQGWGENRRYRVVRGRRLAFIRAQFPQHEGRADNGIGWVAEELVRLKSECPGASETGTAAGNENATEKGQQSSSEAEKPGSNQPARSEISTANITGLSDGKCCNFPLEVRPTAAYDSGMRRFGAGRSGGRRLHAACDLYRRRNDPIESVAPGKVIRKLYYFYQGTYALEVKHSGGFVVRYGEITGRSPRGVYGSGGIKMGQTVGYMGKVNSNCCEPMLHFELFSGNRSGSLSGGSIYGRRSDLMNPTRYLQQWERRKFSR